MGASCGDVVGFSRERARRREVVPLAICCAARIYPYTIYAWFSRKKSCLTGVVMLGGNAGAAARLVPFLTRERRFFFGIAAFLTELPFFPPHNEKSPRPY